MPARLTPLYISLLFAALPYKTLGMVSTVFGCVNRAMTPLVVVGPEIMVVVLDQYIFVTQLNWALVDVYFQILGSPECHIQLFLSLSNTSYSLLHCLQISKRCRLAGASVCSSE